MSDQKHTEGSKRSRYRTPSLNPTTPVQEELCRRCDEETDFLDQAWEMLAELGVHVIESPGDDPPYAFDADDPRVAEAARWGFAFAWFLTGQVQTFVQVRERKKKQKGGGASGNVRRVQAAGKSAELEPAYRDSIEAGVLKQQFIKEWVTQNQGRRGFASSTVASRVTAYEKCIRKEFDCKKYQQMSVDQKIAEVARNLGCSIAVIKRAVED
jgi:hypothetical protein